MAVMSHGCAPVLALGLKVEDDPAWRKEMTSFTFGKNIFHAALHNKILHGYMFSVIQHR